MSQKLPQNFLQDTGEGDFSQLIPKAISASSTLDEILCYGRSIKASDAHLGPNRPIIFRRFSRFEQHTNDVLSPLQISNLCRNALPKDVMEKVSDKGDWEFVYTIKGGGRYRVTLIKQRFGWDITARIIPSQIQSFEISGLPEASRNLTKWAQGMVLVAGPAACGKTSTLATLIQLINQDRHDHIITIEDPIEVVFQNINCQITQRQIGLHTLSQENALRAALREDPDVLIVSELRDLNTIQLAVTAAETGHLVFGTMNTLSAAQTVATLIDSFPPDEQTVITNMISESLRGIIAQQLIPLKDGTGVVPAYEVLVMTPAAANLIRERKFGQLNNVISTGIQQGMVSFDNSLLALIDKGLIDGYEGYKRSFNKNLFQKYAK